MMSSHLAFARAQVAYRQERPRQELPRREHAPRRRRIRQWLLSRQGSGTPSTPTARATPGVASEAVLGAPKVARLAGSGTDTTSF